MIRLCRHCLCKGCSPLPLVNPVAARPQRSSTAKKRDMKDFTAEDMRKDYSHNCRRKAAKHASSCDALTQLDPKKDGDIRKFVVRVATRSRLPQEVIEPFIENNHRLKQQFREDLEALKQAAEEARTAATGESVPEAFDEEALLESLLSKVTALLVKWDNDTAVGQEVVSEPMEADAVSALSRCTAE